MVSHGTWSSHIWLDFLASELRESVSSVPLTLQLQVDFATPSLFTQVCFMDGGVSSVPLQDSGELPGILVQSLVLSRVHF